MDIVAIDARQGKRGKRETVKFAGTEAKEQIDSYINEVHMAKEDMSESASAAASSAKLAESWATGGTFARDDEDVNNAKYWAEYAHTAEEHVVEAENAVLSAETKALAAAEAAALSETHAATSESHAETSEQKAELSESWAVGGTGKREGEDTNNAKYWCEQAQGAVAGVASFNGRSGVVTPQSGDYSYDQISNTPSAATSEADGLMSSADKTKLDGIAEGATKVSIDSDVAEGSANAVSGGGVFTAIKAVKDSIVSTVTASIESIKTAIGDATTSARGLMTAADKTKLDGVATGANKTTLIDNLTTATAGQGALDAHAGYTLAQSLTHESDRAILLAVTLSGGSSNTYTTPSIGTFRNIACELLSGSVLLGSATADKNLFMSGEIIRVFYTDGSLYYADVAYANDTTIAIATTWSTSPALTVRVIGFN